MSDDMNGQPSQPIFRINAQYVRDFSFEHPMAPQTLLPDAPRPEIKVGVDTEARAVADGLYESVLRIMVEAKIEDKNAFVIDLHYAALLTLVGIPSEHIEPLLLVETPRLLFPFARRIVADATRDGGLQPLMLDPLDFAELYRRSREQAAEGNGQA